MEEKLKKYKKINVDAAVKVNNAPTLENIVWAVLKMWCYTSETSIILNDISRKRFEVILNHVLKLTSSDKKKFIYKWTKEPYTNNRIKK